MLLKFEEIVWGFDDGIGKGGVKEEVVRILIFNYEKVVGFVLWGVNDGDKYRDVMGYGFYFVVNVFV